MLFHSVLGLRQVERDIAAALEGAGRRVILPDLYDGARTDDYDEGFRLNEAIGLEAALEARARAAVAEAPDDAVLAGVSFGAFLVGSLWSERPRMPGALLLCGIAPWMEPRRPGLPVSVASRPARSVRRRGVLRRLGDGRRRGRARPAPLRRRRALCSRPQPRRPRRGGGGALPATGARLSRRAVA